MPVLLLIDDEYLTRCDTKEAMDLKKLDIKSVIEAEIEDGHMGMLTLLVKAQADDEEIFRLMERCRDLLIKNTQENYAKITDLVGDEKPPRGKKYHGTDEILAYINENYNKDITIKALAEKQYMSRSNLMHTFKRETGLTINEYLTKVRIEYACKFLKSGRYKIYEVGEMVGYPDVKYFSQIFKRRMGVTPSEYAKNESLY